MNLRGGNNQQSREKIRARMMRNASEIWGQPNATIESFDPLVGMLIGSCATELEKVSNDLQTSQSRVLERLAHLLTPEVLKGARAAHGVAHATSVEPHAVLRQETQFYMQKRTPSRESSTREEFTQIFFTPAKKVRIWDGAVKFTVSDNSIHSFDRVFEREKVVESRSGKRFQSTFMYVGVRLNARIDTLNGLSFFFDWINDPDKTHYYHLLPHTKWFLEERQLTSTTGYANFDGAVTLENDFTLELENDLSKIAERNVSRIYGDHFISITDEASFSSRDYYKKYPSEFESVFLKEELQVFDEDLLWLKVEFPPAMNAQAIQEAVCVINCFPVINRRLHEFTYRLQASNNIIPLKTADEHFYSIKSVKNASSEEYILNSSKDIQRAEAGTFLLRQGGVERFDTRTASELLKYLLDLLRDESASFAVYGNDLLTNNLKELQQMMNTLSQKVDKENISEEQVSYLIVKPKSAMENLFVEYWGTNGEFANAIRSGVKLTPFSGYEVRSESVMLMTNTIGGRDNLSNSETLQAFRKALMSRGRVVTPNDVKLLVFQELGNRVRDVQVKKGFAISNDRKEGFIRNVEVLIYPSNAENTSHDQWEVIGSSIQTMLNYETSGFYPIHVRIANPN
jgi:hypothetical protein